MHWCIVMTAFLIQVSWSMHAYIAWLDDFWDYSVE